MKFSSEKIYSVLKSGFGFDSFLPGQKQVLRDIFEKKHVVAVMPTGGGKSLLYQLPSLLFPGVTVVISPLISLMKDQVDGLVKKGIKSTFINSSLGLEEKVRRTDGLKQGYWDILYIAPERIRDASFMGVLKRADVSFLAVDEAHCISQWGHDFRPDYLAISDMRKALGSPLTIALTATATREVRNDIAVHLELGEWADHVEGFDRENLFFRVTEIRSEIDKYTEIERCLDQMKGSGIIYSATRKHTEAVTGILRSKGISAVTYHGGLKDEERKNAQDMFMKSRVRVVSATNAFGMGIDKRDIRFVVHFDIPGSIEAYYQEVGRAGRDGNISLCHLLFSQADVRIQEFFIRESNPPSHTVRAAWGMMEEYSNGTIISNDAGLPMADSAIAQNSILNMFTKSGFAEKMKAGSLRIIRAEGYGDNMDALIKNSAEKYERDTLKLKKMVAYAYSRACRRDWILDYFGDSRKHSGCSACDNCLRTESSAETVSGEDLETVRNILKAVKSLNGRFGAKKTAQFIKGSRAGWITERQYQYMDTYGICSKLQLKQVQKILDALTEAGCLKKFITQQGYPLLKITESGREVLKGETECRMAFPEFMPKKQPGGSKRNAGKTGNFSHDLFEELKLERTQIAYEKHIPPYRVFHDAALREMASFRPSNPEEFLDIKGVGKKKLDTYGGRFLEIINTWTE